MVTLPWDFIKYFYVSGAACWAPTGCPAALLKRTVVQKFCMNYKDQYKSSRQCNAEFYSLQLRLQDTETVYRRVLQSPGGTAGLCVTLTAGLMMTHTSCRSESSLSELGQLDKSLLCPSLM